MKPRYGRTSAFVAAAMLGAAITHARFPDRGWLYAVGWAVAGCLFGLGLIWAVERLTRHGR